MTQESDWQPTASLETLHKRAEFLATIRQFMAERDILEVETPILSKFGNTDPNIDSLSTQVIRPDQTSPEKYFLQTSPEFAMKRLLAAGVGSIYQICKVFRDNEHSNIHQSEFTMLEWYRPGFDYHDLMDEVAELIPLFGFTKPEKISFSSLFQEAAGFDPHEADITILLTEAKKRGLASEELTEQGLFDFIISDILDKSAQLPEVYFIYDYPACMCALAKLSQTPPIVAKRFELIIKGIEIANGYDELTEPEEQKRRFETEMQERRQANKAYIPADERFLDAIQNGLPDMAGVALGLDRLFMLTQNITEISKAVSFSLRRS